MSSQALTEKVGASFSLGAIASVDAERRVARTEAGAEIEYDSLLLALGARPVEGVTGAVTFRAVLRGLLLTCGGPHFLRTDLSLWREGAFHMDLDPLWWPPAKIVGRYLGPFLAEYAGYTDLSGPPGSIRVRRSSRRPRARALAGSWQADETRLAAH